MKFAFYIHLFLAIALLMSGCRDNNSPSAPDIEREENVEIIWGIGNEIPMAQETPLFNSAPVNMISSWFSKPDDLEWMRYYPERNTLTTLYGQGYAQELIIWLHDYPEYAISTQFQKDLKELIEIFKGNGPEYGPLYVILFTEFETYSDDEEYYLELRDAFMESRQTIKETYEHASVAIGFGGYGWSGIPVREFNEWEEDVLRAGDFIAVQAHQPVNNIDILIQHIRDSFDQLSQYDKPIMMSHFRIWEREGQSGPTTEEAFRKFLEEMFTEESVRELKDQGLFAWNFFWDDFINEPGTAQEWIRRVVHAYGTDKIWLEAYQE